MKVSVIIPLYNTEKYVSECIDSVISQTYEDIEVIVVDDGSTDGSLGVVTSLYGSNEKVKIISQENRGGCAARNVGLQKARGNYIQFLDADDKLDKNKIQSQMDLLKSLQYPTDILVFSGWTILGMPISDMGENQKMVWHDYKNPIDVLVDFILYQCCLPPSVYLTSMDLINKVGGWDESLKRNQDGDFFARIINVATALRFSDMALTYYRSTPNSVSKTISSTVAESWIRSLIKTSEIIINSQHPQAEEAVCKMMSSCLCTLYPYYKKQRAEGEYYLRKVFPDYVVNYPRLNWKERLYLMLQYIKRTSNL